VGLATKPLNDTVAATTTMLNDVNYGEGNLRYVRLIHTAFALRNTEYVSQTLSKSIGIIGNPAGRTEHH
jgi:hypothetical protein